MVCSFQEHKCIRGFVGSEIYSHNLIRGYTRPTNKVYTKDLYKIKENPLPGKSGNRGLSHQKPNKQPSTHSMTINILAKKTP
jgi:hypothetical protein